MTQSDRSAIRVLEGGRKRRERRPRARPNGHIYGRHNDWLKAVVWTAVVGVCVGFWTGVILTILEMSK